MKHFAPFQVGRSDQLMHLLPALVRKYRLVRCKCFVKPASDNLHMS